MSEKVVLAIVGLPGSGKTEATEYLKNKTGWNKVYFGQTVFDEIAKRGLEATEEIQKEVREDLRRIHGMGAMAILNMPTIKEFLQTGSVLLESFYSWGEYLITKQEFGKQFKVLAIHAAPEIREQRMKNRPTRPLKTTEEFEKRDFAQIEGAQQGGPIARADFMVTNEGSREELFSKLDHVIQSLE
jgi:dephospho-CoA kinase